MTLKYKIKDREKSGRKVLIDEEMIVSCDEGISFLGLIFPSGWELLVQSVVSCESVNSALHKNESKLAVLVLSVSFQVLSNIHSLLDQVVEIFRNLRSESIFLENTKNLVASDTFNLRNTVVVSKDNSDLRRGGALLG